MTEQIKKAKRQLEQSQAACVLYREGKFETSHEKGIRPLMDWLKKDNQAFRKGVIADKVVGKAAALLMIRGGVQEVYAGILSEPALESLNRHQVPVSYGTLVPYIINRTRDGMCPMEQACLNTDDPGEAYRILENKLKSFGNGAAGGSGR